MTEPELTSEQATLLALMVLTQRLGGKVTIRAAELIDASRFDPVATTNSKLELIFECRRRETSEP